MSNYLVKGARDDIVVAAASAYEAIKLAHERKVIGVVTCVRQLH